MKTITTVIAAPKRTSFLGLIAAAKTAPTIQSLTWEGEPGSTRGGHGEMGVVRAKFKLDGIGAVQLSFWIHPGYPGEEPELESITATVNDGDMIYWNDQGDIRGIDFIEPKGRVVYNPTSPAHKKYGDQLMAELNEVFKRVNNK